MLNLIGAFLQSDSSGGGAFGIVFLLVLFAIAALVVIAGWIVFTKAGEPGWAVLIPIYNAIVVLRIAGKPWWWIFLMMIPLVNIVISILVGVAVAENFGKGAGFGVGLAFFGFIFVPILAFGDAEYRPVS